MNQNPEQDAQRDKIVATALAEFSFANPQHALADAKALFGRDLKLSGGQWVGPTGEPGVDYVRKQVVARPNWTASNGTRIGTVRPEELDPEGYHKLTPARRAEVDSEMKALAVAWLGGGRY